jgi:hypothetical protein
MIVRKNMTVEKRRNFKNMTIKKIQILKNMIVGERKI